MCVYVRNRKKCDFYKNKEYLRIKFILQSLKNPLLDSFGDSLLGTKLYRVLQRIKLLAALATINIEF